MKSHGHPSHWHAKERGVHAASTCIVKSRRKAPPSSPAKPKRAEARAPKTSETSQLANKTYRDRTIKSPKYPSFEEFLRQAAQVPCGRGLYGDYSFAGREALLAVVRTVDQVLGNAVSDLGSRENPRSQTQKPKPHPTPDARPQTPDPLTDAEVSLAGGAQFGKTILELNLAAYVTSQQFRNFGLYLPDDDLVEGIVDSKFRPDVVDQIGWFADMVQVGKALNKSGKAVNRKGAFLVTDGRRKSVGMIRGLGKVPTTFSMDVGAMDEVDDIDPKMMKYVRGRLTASDLRFIFKIGTQRVHGRGMNKAWKDGSQGVFVFRCAQCGRLHNPEEEFPGIVRLGLGTRVSVLGKIQDSKHQSPDARPQMPDPRLTWAGDNTGSRVSSDRANNDNGPLSRGAATPKLTWAGDFRQDGNDQPIATHSPSNHYFLACVSCGTELDRSQPIEQHRAPALITQRKWSYRISQLAIGAIDLSQIVGRFQSAVADPEEMIVFRCDVLGLPQSTAQALTPAILDRARAVTAFDMSAHARENQIAYAGLDMGDRCWLFARSGASADRRHNNPEENNPALCRDAATVRLLAAERIPAGDVVARAQSLFHTLGLSALFIDERPLVNESRTIALALNGLQSLTTWPRIANVNTDYIVLPGGLTWDGRNSRWLNLKCAVVRFTKSKLGAGIEQTVVFFEEGGQTKFVPCIACNRFETIDRVVREFLTPSEGVVEMTNGKVRETPGMLLPRRTPGHPPILETVDAHLITGSERVKAADGSLGDYVDGCENHFLLADGYSKLAEIVCGKRAQFATAPIMPQENTRRSRILATRANRSVE